MTKTEIKKELYKQKPDAFLRFICKGNAHYFADLEEERITFRVPVSDMGDAIFKPRMDGKLLIRWLIL